MSCEELEAPVPVIVRTGKKPLTVWLKLWVIVKVMVDTLNTNEHS